MQDIDYAEQQALYYLHIAPEEYEAQPYERMMEVLNAKSRDDRPLGASDFFKQMGVSPKEANKLLESSKKGGK